VDVAITSAHNFLTGFTGNSFTQAQPACSDLSNATAYCSATVGQLPGVTTNTNASAGNIGEYVSSTVLGASELALTTLTPKTITSISLTAGDWDVWASFSYDGGAGSNTTTSLTSGISTTTNAFSVITPGNLAEIVGQTGISLPSNASASPYTQSLGPVRQNLSGTTTIFMVAQCGFSAGACGGYGIIQARRVH
jgi:hypothetical protein